MKKYWKTLSAITLTGLLLTACGTSDEKVNNDNTSGDDGTGYETPADEGEKDSHDDVITSEMVSTNLQFIDGTYTFTLKNTTDEDIVLTFSSSQEYEYTLTDSEGNLIYTYSMDKSFMQAITEKTIAPEEEYMMMIDMDILSTLESGTYTLEVWTVAKNTEGLKEQMEITIDEANAEATGTYIGQIDNNSVEIKDQNGNAKAYRLAGTAKDFITFLETEQEVKFSYYEQDGQLFLSMIEAKQ